MTSGSGAADEARRTSISSVPREGRPYQGRRAGVVSRVLANTVDFAVVVVVVAAGYGAVSAALFLWSPSRFHFPDFRGGALLLAGALVMLCYLLVSWAMTGQTYGDHLLGLRVVGPRGERLPLVVAAARAVLCLAFPLGVLWVAVSRTNRSVQDLLLRTSVVYDWAPTHLVAVDARPEADS